MLDKAIKSMNAKKNKSAADKSPLFTYHFIYTFC